MEYKKSLSLALGLTFIVVVSFLIQSGSKGSQTAQVANQNSITVASPLANATFAPGQTMTVRCDFTTETGTIVYKIVSYRYNQTNGSMDFFTANNPPQTGSYSQEVTWPANNAIGKNSVGCVGYFANYTTGVYTSKNNTRYVYLNTSAPQDTSAPTAPTNVLAGSLTETSANISWTASTDNTAVTGYKVFNAATNAEIGNVTSGTSYSWTGLTAGTNYGAYVKAFDAAGNISTSSTIASFTTSAASSSAVNSVSVATPVAGSNLNVGQALTLTCNATIKPGYSLYKFTFSATQQGLSPITFAALSNPDQGGVYSRDITIPANAAIGKPFKFDCMGEYWNSTTSHYEQKHGYSSVNIVSGTPPPTTGDTTAPTMPGAPSVSYRDSSRIDFAWTASTDNTGVTGYKVLRSVGGGAFAQIATSVPGTTYSDTTTNATSTYAYKIQATDAAGNNSAQSASGSAPTISTDFAVNDEIATTAAVNVRQTAGGSVVGTQPSGAQGIVASSGVFASGYHYFNINFTSGADGFVAQDYLDTYFSPVPDTSVPTTPTGLSVSGATNTSLSLNWNNSTDNVAVTGYKILRATSVAGPFTQIATSISSDYVNTGLTSGTTYYYAITAYDAAGNNSLQSSAVSGATTTSTAQLSAPNTASTLASVQLGATAQTSPASITLSWAAVPNRSVSAITIKRSSGYNSPTWTTVATPSSSSTSWTDTSVTVGTYYEYQVDMTTSSGNAKGYIASGINVPLEENKGKIILVVDNTFQTSLASKIQTLVDDLTADRWTVLPVQYVSRSAAPASVRSTIKSLYDSNANVKAVYLLGHVPVPTMMGNPDGHGSRLMSTNNYYAEMNSTWTSVADGCSGANWAPIQSTANLDVPATNARFCVSSIPSTLELQVGRVDFYEVTAFGGTETSLLSAYLDKVHSFKTKEFTPQYRAYIRDRFANNGWPGGRSAWASIPSIIGLQNISSDKSTSPTLQTILNNQSYVFAFGNYFGANTRGSSTAATGDGGVIGSTTAAASTSWGGVFNFLFGSYFGEWNDENAYIKSLLASGKAMANIYAGDRYWYLHSMGMGQNIGYGAKLSVNNSTSIYPPVGGIDANSYSSNGYMTLFGDLSLRLRYEAMPSNLTLSNNGGKFSFSWSSASGADGYNVYEITSTSTRRVNSTPISGTSYNSNDTYSSGKKYMVTAIKNTVSPSGTYPNESLGTMKSN